MENAIYYNSKQNYGLDCIVYEEIYIVKTLKSNYMVIQITNYASNCASDIPPVIQYKSFDSGYDALGYAHELEKEW